jgi:hypothetical protein
MDPPLGEETPGFLSLMRLTDDGMQAACGTCILSPQRCSWSIVLNAAISFNRCICLLEHCAKSRIPLNNRFSWPIFIFVPAGRCVGLIGHLLFFVPPQSLPCGVHPWHPHPLQSDSPKDPGPLRDCGRCTPEQLATNWSYAGLCLSRRSLWSVGIERHHCVGYILRTASSHAFPFFAREPPSSSIRPVDLHYARIERSSSLSTLTPVRTYTHVRY